MEGRAFAAPRESGNRPTLRSSNGPIAPDDMERIPADIDANRGNGYN
jgi:hypothetical protein